MAQRVLYGVGKSILRSISDPNEILALSKLVNVTIESSVNEDDLYGGDSPYPFVSFPTDRAITVTAENATFDIKMLSFAQGAELTTGVVTMHDVMNIAIPDECTVELHEGAKNVVVLGFTKVDDSESLTAGQYVVESNVVTFAAEDVGKEVDIVYEYPSSDKAQTATNTEQTLSKPFTFIHRIPIYDDNSKIVGEGQLIIYRAKASNSFTFDFERQTAFTPNLELRALDAKRADGKLWDFTIDPV